MISASAVTASDLAMNMGIAGNPNVLPGLRSRLKEATAEAHHQLDAKFGGFDISGLKGYRRFLEASAAALLPLEQALEEAGVAAEFADWNQRSRREAILSDLAKVDGAARPMTMTQALTRNSLFGAMYVLEGSRLGAKFMMRELARSADPQIASATAYLGHGKGQHFWQSFLAKIENEPPDDNDEAIEGARTAFAMFEQAAACA